MRIECPGCEAAYEVPEAQIRPGRSVRCASCGRQWLPVPDPAETMPRLAAEAMSRLAVEAIPEAAPELMIPEAPAGTARVQLRQPSAPKPAASGSVAPIIARFGLRLAMPVRLLHRMRSALKPWGLGWAASLVVLAGLLVAAGYWRASIMQGWPPSIRLYVALGAQSPPT